jgi:ABC-type antimicrobial peptide transport system permease subunit
MMPAIRRAVSDLNPAIPVVTVETQISQIDRRLAQEKVLAEAYTLFGSIALFVAAIGLFGLMSYNVSRRTREIGIRMAMGAEGREVLALVLRESMTLVAIGIMIGLAASLVGGRLISSQLFGLEPTDAVTMASAVLVLIGVSITAGYVPARRAARVDPIVALRYE